MDLEVLEALQTAVGRSALARAMALGPTDATFLKCFNRLSKEVSGEVARAALQTAMLRQRGRAKFSAADAMFFTREALEQASSEAVARHRARRFAGLSRVADLCCGIGGDALALTEVGEVLAVDNDPLHLAMTGLNLAAVGRRERATLVAGDVLQVELAGIAGVFVDPDRRVEGRRELSIARYQPGVEAVLGRFAASFPVGVKLAPGVPLDELRGIAGELEFISLGGELKECVLWRGPLAQTGRRATLLPGGHALSAEEPCAVPEAEEPGEWLYDPDPAVSRAGLVGELAELLEAWPVDAGIVYLSSAEQRATPFAKVHRIEAVLPFHVQRLREYLRERSVGRVQVQRRGSPVEPASLERELRLKGDEFRTLLLTQVVGRHSVIVVDPGGA
ncbi:MAG: hypothetical protein U0840_22520 [Gemmataceae bacterium]